MYYLLTCNFCVETVKLHKRFLKLYDALSEESTKTMEIYPFRGIGLKSNIMPDAMFAIDNTRTNASDIKTNMRSLSKYDLMA